MSNDFLQSFHLDSMPLTGRGVKLSHTLETVLTQHQYPEVINHLLAEMMVLGSILSGSFKHKGRLTLQIKGSQSYVQVAVVEVTHDGHVRAYARFEEDAPPPKTHSLKALLGDGLLMFNLDEGDTNEPYQGIVALKGNTLQEAMEHYWVQSEQLKAELFLHVAKKKGQWVGGGVVIHQLPGGTEDQWDEALALTRTLTPQEFLDPELSLSDLFFRLFHTHGVRVFQGHTLEPKCSCSSEKLSKVFLRFSKEDLKSLLEDGFITAKCEFCNKDYRYSEKELGL